MKNYFKISFLFSIVLLVAGCGSSSSNGVTIVTPGGIQIFYAHNAIFKNSSTVLSTGYNGYGQFGNNSINGSSTVVGLDKYYPFRGIAAGGNHSVAFSNNSSVVYSWGLNNFGQLGNATVTNSSVPVRTGSLTGVKFVAAGAYHTVAASSDTVWSWGLNDFGQLGVSSIKAPLGYSATPVTVGVSTTVLFSNISSVVANGRTTLVRANGNVFAWGSNSRGQVGLPTTFSYSADPVTINFSSTAALLPIRHIAAGSAFGLAVDSSGSLWTWGANDDGQLGNGTKISNHLPSQVMSAAGVPLTNVIRCAGGLYHGMALLSDGTVWAWGTNDFHQLGPQKDSNGATVFPNSTYAVKVLNMPGTVTDIRAFGNSSMAMIGGVWYGWGDNWYGQLGNGSSGNKFDTPTRMAGF